MDAYRSSNWGDRFADVYGDVTDALMGPGETEAAVARLAELANGGPVLELGIGTGRVALPLAEQGLEVHGIDASEAMVAKLREQPGAERIHVTVGDIADAEIEGTFPLIFAVLNTFSYLHDEEAQIRCMENVADHLTDDGVFVVEATVPSIPDEQGQSFTIWAIEDDRLMVSFERHDRRTRSMRSFEVWLSERGIRTFSTHERPVPPTELDLMARIAGLRLRERWATWDREPFLPGENWHVSVYAKSGRE